MKHLENVRFLLRLALDVRPISKFELTVHPLKDVKKLLWIRYLFIPRKHTRTIYKEREVGMGCKYSASFFFYSKPSLKFFFLSFTMIRLVVIYWNTVYNFNPLVYIDDVSWNNHLNTMCWLILTGQQLVCLGGFLVCEVDVFNEEMMKTTLESYHSFEFCFIIHSRYVFYYSFKIWVLKNGVNDDQWWLVHQSIKHFY